MSFKDFYTEELVLTEEGKKFLQPLQRILFDIFNTKEVLNMSESESQILSDSITGIVKNLISNQRNISKILNQDIQLMSDQEFESYLHHKYGSLYILKSLTAKEFDRAMAMCNDSIEEAFQKAQENSKEYRRQQNNAINKLINDPTLYKND